MFIRSCHESRSVQTRSTARHAVQDVLNEIHLAVSLQPAFRPEIVIQIHKARRGVRQNDRHLRVGVAHKLRQRHIRRQLRPVARQEMIPHDVERDRRHPSRFGAEPVLASVTSGRLSVSTSMRRCIKFRRQPQGNTLPPGCRVQNRPANCRRGSCPRGERDAGERENSCVFVVRWRLVVAAKGVSTRLCRLF